MSSPLKQYTTTIQELLYTINSLPEAGTELPELSNPAIASELFANKELIVADGNVVTGTFTIDSELTTQDTLIAQIQTALEGKAADSSSGSGGGSVETITIKYSSSSLPDPDMMIRYIDGAMSLKSATVNKNSSFTIAKNTIFVTQYYFDDSYDGCKKICGNDACSAFLAIK